MSASTRSAAALCSVLVFSACELGSPDRDAANVRGSWAFTGNQTAPDVDLDGTFVIATQDGQSIAGTATWDETGVGGIVVVGGPLAGRAIGQADVDFDVTLSAGTRRFVARLSADTMTGAWVQVANGTNGTFRAVRSAP